MRTSNALLGVFTITLALLAQVQAQSFLTNGLVAYYPLDGNANDASGNGDNGFIGGNNYAFGPSSFNDQEILYLNTNTQASTGANESYVSASNRLDFNGDFSLSVWVNIPDGLGGYHVHNFISDGSDQMSANFRLISNVNTDTDTNGNDYLQFVSNLADNSPGANVYAFLPQLRNTWWHAVVTRSGTNVSLFQNGAFVESGVWTTSMTNNSTMWLGAMWSYDNGSYVLGYPLVGGIADVRMYDRALSLSEVQELYAYESGVAAFIDRVATAAASLTNGFVVEVNVTDGGYGYTTTPTVRLIGGGGSGAQAVVVVSNEVVIAVNVLDTGNGYTNAPLVVIDPPFIPSPVLGIAPMSFLSFSNLTVGGDYQLQQLVAWYWTNQPVSFTAASSVYTQMVSGVTTSGDYRLAISPVPAQAFAVAQVVNGFVTGATVTSAGSGYVASPTVSIVGGGGTNASAICQVSNGVVTNIAITDAGIGYTNIPIVQIGQPPAAAVSPAVLPVIRLDVASLAPYDNYQIQFTAAIDGTWENWNGGLFTPTGVTNSQYLFITNEVGFFRLQYVP